MTAQDISIVDVENLKIKSHCNAIVFMMEKGFVDSSGDEDEHQFFEVRVHIKLFLYKKV